MCALYLLMFSLVWMRRRCLIENEQMTFLTKSTGHKVIVFFCRFLRLLFFILYLSAASSHSCHFSLCHHLTTRTSGMSQYIRSNIIINDNKKERKNNKNIFDKQSERKRMRRCREGQVDESVCSSTMLSQQWRSKRKKIRIILLNANHNNSLCKHSSDVQIICNLLKFVHVGQEATFSTRARPQKTHRNGKE